MNDSTQIRLYGLIIAMTLLTSIGQLQAQTGVSDDRVSLGP
ncbi:MAG: hypothetical protein AAFS10_02705 [Myxococcota bacterium]